MKRLVKIRIFFYGNEIRSLSMPYWKNPNYERVIIYYLWNSADKK
jgi:hypothetical protein